MPPKKLLANRPKRKQAPTGTPSSSDEETQFFNFVDDEAVQLHRSRYANREVLTRRKVFIRDLPSIEPLFQFQNLVPFLASIGDRKYYPHLVAQFYANLSSSEYACESDLLGIDMPFDDVLLGQVPKIPSTSIDLSLSFEELCWNFKDVNKSISQNKRSTFKPNRLNQLSKQSRFIAYILAANIVQKKGHSDELSDLCCKGVYAITNRISVN